MTHEAGIEAAYNAVMEHEKVRVSFVGLENAIQAYISASGMVLVPREPTPEMVKRMDLSYLTPDEAKSSLKYIIAAAPNPFESKP